MSIHRSIGDAWDGSSRRHFLTLAAKGTAALAATTALSGCHVLGAAGKQGKLDFGDDFGVLNYAYTLETLEADFYRQVMRTPPNDLRPGELEVLRDIGEHEIRHQQFFKRALNILRSDVPDRDFSSINFSSRSSVLAAAKTLEDTGVAAYNGAGRHLMLAEFLTIAGKIVSVEARHAAAIRDMIDPNSRAFAGDDVVDAQGRDLALPPATVIQMVQPFFKQPLKLRNV